MVRSQDRGHARPDLFPGGTGVDSTRARASRDGDDACLRGRGCVSDPSLVMISLRLSGACEGSRARGAVSGVRASATVAVLSFYDGVAVWWSVASERARVFGSVAVARGFVMVAVFRWN